MLDEVSVPRERLEALQACEREHIAIQELLALAVEKRNLAELAAVAVLYVDPHTMIIVDANERALALLGYERDDLCCHRITDLENLIFDADHPARTYVQSDREEQIYAASYRHRAGYPLPVSVHRRQLSVEEGKREVLHYSLEEQTLYHSLLEELIRRENSGYQYSEKLKQLNTINLQLAKVQSLDELFRRGVELGLRGLGFDRMSFWLYDEGNHLMIGTYGVDEAGKLRDEHDARWSYADTFVEEMIAGKTDQYIVRNEAPIYNHHSQVVSHGWHITVPLMNGRHFLGLMTVDNLISRRPLQEFEPELLRMYGIMIGHLIAIQSEQETTHKLSTAIQHSASMIAILNEQGVIEFVNEAFLQVSGYDRADVLGNRLEFLLPEGDHPELWNRITAHQAWHGELQQRKKSGDTYDALTSISFISSGNRTRTCLFVQEDITELKQARTREFNLRLEQERIRLIEDFVRDVGHEFRTPLSVVQVSSYLLAKTSDQEITRKAELATRIEEQVAIIEQMMQDLIYIVRLDSETTPRIEPVNLSDVLHHVVSSHQPLLRERDLTWQLQFDPALIVSGDPDRLTRMLNEIVKNAIQYTDDPATITISISSTGEWVQVAVQDNGIGIPPSELDHIFERLYRVDKARTRRGTGLGLSIAKLIAEGHQGSISVQSSFGHGSTFTVRLPARAG